MTKQFYIEWLEQHDGMLPPHVFAGFSYGKGDIAKQQKFVLQNAYELGNSFLKNNH